MTSQSLLAEIIRSRRTIRHFNAENVSISTLKHIFELATFAPFHKKEEPWRLILIHGEGKERLIQTVIQSLTLMEAPEATIKAYTSYLRTISAFTLVIMEESESKRQWEDDLCATATLIQNIQLLAWEQQIGMVWKSFNTEETHPLKAHFDIGENEKIVGLLLIGHFDKIPSVKQRKPLDEILTVIEK
ncbi:nitroreductase [Hazenella sp. IB182353]|uniref:nitroreductase family protein n=1 Tax=Polycladospora coralii TaxID=2771432 RepID=UPI0017475261|nr:nitroreductase [Polycladospora coralii]MBS7529335.1 nitroreductase [Polycladospora coralii]